MQAPLRTVVAHWPTAAVVALGVGLSWDLAQRADGVRDREAQQRFLVEATSAESQVDHHLESYSSVVLNAAGLFAASDGVERHEWARFIELSGIFERVPGVLGLGYLERVDLEQEDAFLERVRSEGLEVEGVREFPGSDRGLVHEPRYLFRFHAPAANEVKIGVDVSRHTAIKAVFDEAMRCGESRLLPSLELGMTPGVPTAAVLIHPIYREGRSLESEESRVAALQGWVASTLHFGRLLEETSLIDLDRLRVEILGATAHTSATLANSIPPGHASRYRHTATLPFAGAELRLRLEAADDSIFVPKGSSTPLLVAGLLLTGALAVATAQLVRALGRARRVSTDVQRQIAPFTAAVESAPDPTLLIDLQGRIQFANGRAREVARYLGRSSDSGLEHMAFQLDPGFRDRILDSVLRGKTLVEPIHLESAAHLGSERELWLEVTASPVQDAEGSVLCILWTERDVTEIVKRDEHAEARSQVAAAWARASAQLVESGPLSARLEAILEEVVGLEGVGLGNAAVVRTVGVPDSSEALAIQLGAGGLEAIAERAARFRDAEVRVEFVPGVQPEHWRLSLAHEAEALGTLWIATDASSSPLPDLGEFLNELAELISRALARHHRAEQQRQVDMRLELLAQRLGVATTGAGVGTWELDPADDSVVWDDTMFRIFGLEPGQTPTLEEWKSFVHPDEREAVLEEFYRAFEAGELFEASYRVIPPDGRLRHIRASASFLRDDQGVVRHVIGANWDTTDIATTLELLRDSQAVARVGSWAFDVNTEQVTWSEQLYHLFGRDPHGPAPSFEQILQEDYDEESAKRLLAAVYRARTTGLGYTILLRKRDDSDGIRWLQAEGRVRRGHTGEVVELYGTVFDMTEMVERELALREITAALDASSEAVFMFEAGRHNFVYSNQCAREKLGWSVESLQGRTPHQLLHSEDHEKLDALLDGLRRDPSQTLVTRTQLRGHIEGHLPVEVALQLLPDLGPEGRFLAICRDITKQLEAEEQLRQAADDATAANRAKGDFLANMSHEIRTPMTAILGFTDLLLEGVTGDAPKDELESSARTIQSSARHLLALVNDILDMSKIESGQLHLESIDCQLVEIVEGVTSALAPIAADKGVGLHLEWLGPVPRTIRTDPTRLRQVLYNLAGNAVKFTAEGAVTIRVGFDVAQEQLRFVVEDTGIGMTPEQLRAVRRFEAFTQADASTTRRFGGTGLGLRISNALTRALGGDFELDSTPGEGTQTVFTVPVGGAAGRELIDPKRALAEVEPARPVAAKPDRGAPRPLEGLRVLVVEDGLDNQKLIKIHLRRAGAQVDFCNNGLECLDRMADPEQPVPDVVLMDMQMPELDGYGATRELRSQGCKLPIIAVTANVMTGDRERCIEAGCDDFVAKPIDHVVMVEACARWAGVERDGSQVA